MKSLILLFTLAMITAASAQMPQTVPLKSNQTGEAIGTATMSGSHIYFRDLKGELIATIVVDKDGTKTMYDPSGKVLDQITSKPK